MADINLRDYIARLDQLLADGNISEVIHHCRHILQFYPRHATVYRFLGRALIESRAYPEASEVLRRVLSVFPDDLTAHAGLSEVYSEDHRFDDAIWHLERAFENDPNNQAILDRLRELYRRHRRVEHARVQLTAGAVSRQYLRNGLHEQAVEALHQALDRSPDRMDLKILLAQAYWNAGQRVEAAEQAVEVLRVLPDCFEANRMLSELWLGEGRPTDAQRYINRLQSLDPYLALQLAKGQEVPDNAFRLSELDYRRAAEQEMVNQSPDWLDDISQAGTGFAVASEAAHPEEHELPDLGQAGFSGRPPDDWFTDLPPAPEPVATPRRRTGLTGLLSHYDKPEPESAADEQVAPGPTIEAPAQPQFALPNEPTAETIEAASAIGLQPIVDNQPDPLGWLKEHGVELTGDEQVARLQRRAMEEDITTSPTGDTVVDPLAWLDDFGGKDQLLTDEAAIGSGQPADEELPAAAPDDEMDPLAWLRDTSINQEQPRTVAATHAPDTESASLDWLSDDSMLHEALDLEALVGGSATQPTDTSADDVFATTERQGEMADEKDLYGSDLPWSEPEQDGLSAPESTPGQEEATLPAYDEAPDWLVEAAPQVADESVATPQGDLEFPDWMNEAPAAEAAADVPDWLTQTQPEQATPVEEPAAEAAPVADEAGFEWMAQPEAAAEPAAEMSEDVPDWLTQMQPDQAADARTDFDWNMAGDTQADSASLEQPSWLSQLESAEAAANSLAAAGEAEVSTAELEAEIPAEDMPGWLAQLRDAEITPPAEPVPARPAQTVRFDDDETMPWEVQPGADLEAEQILADRLTPAATAMPSGDVGWIDEINATSAELEGPADEVAAASGLLAASRFVPDSDAARLAAPEFIEEGTSTGLAPASNAPDWLNAMVPGLDVDYGASEDAPIETDFVEGSQHRLEPEYPETPRSRTKREFDWLSSLVDEETQQVRPVLESARRGRFVFSKKPIWLREPTEQPDASVPVVASDSDDIDLPPWMQ